MYTSGRHEDRAVASYTQVFFLKKEHLSLGTGMS
jgi:hypothetical protein